MRFHARPLGAVRGWITRQRSFWAERLRSVDELLTAEGTAAVRDDAGGVSMARAGEVEATHRGGPLLGPLKTVGIYVADQQRAIDFYVGMLGFVVRRRAPMGPNAEWVEVSSEGGQTALVLYPRSMMPDWAEKRPSVVFHCPDVEATCRELAARGVAITTQPTPMAWGTFAAFADPDGNEFGLTTQAIA
jgi:predicted enzyme related to lactoylglutathione lyase